MSLLFNQMFFCFYVFFIQYLCSLLFSGGSAAVEGEEARRGVELSVRPQPTELLVFHGIDNQFSNREPIVGIAVERRLKLIKVVLARPDSPAEINL